MSELSLEIDEGGPTRGGAVPPWSEIDRRERGTRFLAITAKSVINSAASTRMPFASVNPYIGCEFGCAYCYARDTHHWTVQRALDGIATGDAIHETATLLPDEAFEKRILVKQNAAAILLRTLSPARLGGAPLVIGTATDPYQPAERRFRITRALLESLLHYRGLRLGIITKSPLITRDLDLLVRLAEHNRLTINFSLAAIDGPLLRCLEPRSPVPTARLRALAKLAAAGLRVGLLIAPILPGINDGYGSLRSLVAAGRDAGATWAAGSPLRMGPATRRTLLPWIRRERPELAERYERHFGNGPSVTREYARALQRRLVAVQLELGMEPREGMERGRELSQSARDRNAQIDLWK